MVFFLEIYEIVQSTLGQVETQKKGNKRNVQQPTIFTNMESAFLNVPFYRA